MQKHRRRGIIMLSAHTRAVYIAKRFAKDRVLPLPNDLYSTYGGGGGDGDKM